MSGSVGKSRNTTTSSGQTGFDPQTQAWIDQIYQASRGAAGQPPPSAVSGAQNYYGGATAAGQRGIAALGGDAGAAQQFMNPYQQQVIDQLNRQFQVGNEMTTRGVNDAATRAGAFGGTRHGVTEGVALAENTRNRDQQVASLLNSGFEGAMGRAGQLAGLGMGAAGAGADLGMAAGNPDLWRMEILRRGFQGLPYGQTTRGTEGTTGSGFSVGFGRR